MAEYKNGRLQLPMVTLTAVSSVNIIATIRALLYSMRKIDYGEVILVTHRKPVLLPRKISYRHIDKIESIDEFNYNMIFKLHQYINTKYMLLVHYDGFVVNPDKWQDEFLEFDYIGSPFPVPTNDYTFRDHEGKLCRVGNSVSIRSKRLMEFPETAKMPFEPENGWYNEDVFICCKNRHLFEQAGMKYAPLELAVQFGQENEIPEAEGIRPFVFHKWAGKNIEYPRFHTYSRITGPINKVLKRFKHSAINQKTV